MVYNYKTIAHLQFTIDFTIYFTIIYYHLTIIQEITILALYGYAVKD